MATRDSLYIGGEWVPSGGGTAAVLSPATGEPVGAAPVSTTSDVDAAVAAARRALRSPEWGGLTPEERSESLLRFADELEKNAHDRAALTSAQNGLPITVATMAEGFAPISIVRYHAGLAASTPVEDRRPRVDGEGETVVRREPIGVVAVVVPWNFPQPLAMFKVAAALAAGCAVVLKPAEQTPLGALELAAAADRAGLGGALNVVTGGADIGRHLVAHPGVDRVAFTGSTPVGREVGEVCGRLLRRVSLALSSRSAALVLDDADITAVGRSLGGSIFMTNGYTCYAGTRVLVPARHHDELVEVLAGVASSLTIGDPLDQATQMGPMVSQAHRARVESFVSAGRASGATLAAGGSRPDTDRGWYVSPTVFGDVEGSSPIARDEILGPVLTVTPYRSLEEAVAIAEDSDYGLSGTVWTSDVDRGLEVARTVRTGAMGVNFVDLDLGAPYGGLSASGLGYDLGPEGFASYSTLKSIYLPRR
ncbi:aldehyde dehydrogenase family protein [Actinosynnema sp. NPDC002837]